MARTQEWHEGVGKVVKRELHKAERVAAREAIVAELIAMETGYTVYLHARGLSTATSEVNFKGH